MKNQRIKININRTPLNSEDINKLQGFGSVLAAAKAAHLPFYKKWWFWGTAGVAILAAIAVGITVNNNNEAPVTEKAVVQAQPAAVASTPAQAPFINPAIKGIDISFTTFIVTSGRKKILQMPTGTRILIPACYFLNRNNENVQGEVEIRFREFRDPVDFAISGIPMTYDSAGQKYVFESAGMCEIQGWQNGEEVFINPQCPVTIEQNPVSVDGKFNMYYLDTVQRNWQFMGKPNWINRQVDEIQTVNADEKSIITAPLVSENHAMRMRDSLPEKPLPPRKLNRKKNNFFIMADSVAMPQVNEYKTAMFEVDEMETDFTPALYKYIFQSVKIEEVEQNQLQLTLEQGAYSKGFDHNENPHKDASIKKRNWFQQLVYDIMRFLGKKETPMQGGNRQQQANEFFPVSDTALYLVKAMLVPIDSNDYKYDKAYMGNLNHIVLSVYPVYEGEAYEKALQEYKEKLEKYEAMIAERLQRQQQALQKQQELWRQQAEQARLEAAKPVNERKPEYWNVRNAFEASKFGIYNTDHPVVITSASKTKIDFIRQNGGEQQVDIVYLVVKNRNVLMANYYHNCCNNQLTYRKNDDNLLFTVFPDGRLGYCSEEDFKKMHGSGKYDLALTISDKEFATVGEIKEFLGVDNKEEDN